MSDYKFPDMYEDEYQLRDYMLSEVKRVTVNLPAQLLKQAMDVTEDTLTKTIVEGLLLLRKTRAFHRAQKLKGKLNFNINLEESRERITRRR